MTSSEIDFAITCWQTVRRVMVSSDVRRDVLNNASFESEKQCRLALETRQREEPGQFKVLKPFR